MALQEWADKIITAVQGDDEAIKKVMAAIGSTNPAEIRRVVGEVAKLEISEAEAQAILADMGPDPHAEASNAT